MAMTLKDVLDGQAGQAELAGTLVSAKADLEADIRAKSTSIKTGELQGQLTKLFYGEPSAFQQDYNNSRLAEASEKLLMEAFRNFNFEENTAGHYNRTQGMDPNTLRKQLKKGANDLKRVIEQITKTDSQTDLQHLIKLRDETRQLIKNGYKILREAERTLQFGTQERITGDDFKEAKLIVNQLMGLNKALSVPDFVTPQEAGLIFEKALTMTNFINDASDMMEIEAARTLSGKLGFGQETIARGGDIIKYTIAVEDVSEEDLKSKRFKLDQGNMTVTYTFNPGEARQGKMDVQLHYDQPDQDNYRVSAKRWSKGKGDLGETSIEAGLGRHGLSLLEAYKFGILKPQNDWLDGEEPKYAAAQAAHDWAILALKADIAMGITQGKTQSGAGYANVLVVDTGEEIKVRDLAKDVVLNENYKLSKYNASTLESEASRIYNSMHSRTDDRTSTYLTNMSTMLDKMKVTINMNFNKADA